MKNAQKLFVKIVKFVHTFRHDHDIIILVKTPQYIIYFLLYPIVKYLLLKRQWIDRLSFFCVFSNGVKQYIIIYILLKENPICQYLILKVHQMKIQKNTHIKIKKYK